MTESEADIVRLLQALGYNHGALYAFSAMLAVMQKPELAVEIVKALEV